MSRGVLCGRCGNVLGHNTVLTTRCDKCPPASCPRCSSLEARLAKAEDVVEAAYQTLLDLCGLCVYPSDPDREGAFPQLENPTDRKWLARAIVRLRDNVTAYRAGKEGKVRGYCQDCHNDYNEQPHMCPQKKVRLEREGWQEEMHRPFVMAMRKADVRYRMNGAAGTKAYVINYLFPELEAAGLFVGRLA